MNLKAVFFLCPLVASIIERPNKPEPELQMPLRILYDHDPTFSSFTEFTEDGTSSSSAIFHSLEVSTEEENKDGKPQWWSSLFKQLDANPRRMRLLPTMHYEDEQVELRFFNEEPAAETEE